MKAIIDPKAGFCGGVKRAITLAEELLQQGGRLAVKGELIHNRLEMERLQALGLKYVDDLEEVEDCPILVRTHGEDGAFFQHAQELDLETINATCPKVRRSQSVIRRAHQQGRQIIIVGRINHPEVIALQGHCEGQAIVVYKDDLPVQVDSQKPTLLIAQTTVAPEIFAEWQERLQRQMLDLEVFDSRCSFVTRRQKELAAFAAEHPAVVFVGGKNSSNTALLFNVCRQINPRSYFVENEGELDPDWFRHLDRVGVSGSASTPMWQLRRVADAIESLIEV
jgi:4-hydroxy-3-methylbut-2-enyl diphosphate reductase